MKVSNIRFGFATNSSSTHSIVVLGSSEQKGIETQRMLMALQGVKAAPVCDQGFGWEEFMLTTEHEKKEYMGQLLYHTLLRETGEDIALLATENLLQIRIDPDGYIDHQSFMDLPLDLYSKHTSIAFFKELLQHYLKSNLIILGGSDNEENHLFLDARKDHILPTDANQALICRKDKGWWTLHNKNTGIKIKLTFDDRAEPYVKATAPELIDLKITNQCVMNCNYCYQDSNINGKHATMANIGSILYRLPKPKPFEIVLGGGEPTLHPKFADIVREIAAFGPLVNFTTRDLRWTANSEIVQCVEDHVARFAVSVNHPIDITAALEKIPKNIQNKVYFQFVMGTGNLEYLLEEIGKHSYPLILLGYKEKGRGTKEQKESYGDWTKLVKKRQAWIGIDTCLANQCKEEVAKNFSKNLVQYEEGKFSMYIDAVDMKVGRCSYCDDSEFSQIDKKWLVKDFQKVFEGF